MAALPVAALCYFLLAQAAPTHAASIVRNSFLLKANAGKGRFEPWWEKKTHHASTRLQCGITEQVGAHTDKYEDCPADCPYFAQNRKDALHCTFLCVPGSECGSWNPNKPIPDSIKNSKTCRGPRVDFCTTPKLDGTDRCDVCMSGYTLHHDDGQCYFEQWTLIISIVVVFVVLLTFVIMWVVDLCCRTPINEESVREMEVWRSRSKNLKPSTQDRARHPYETTEVNLCNEPIAGPGMLLHFNFQAFFIIWPFCVACVWVALACFHNELFILGTRKFGTPRHNCILVAWGYETQQRLMWTKVLFLVIVYLGSFVAFLLFSIRQLRTYQRIDWEKKTMKHFAIELKGLPDVPGTSATIEDEIAKAVQDHTGKTVVGVSIAWNYGESAEDVDAACQEDLARRAFAMQIEKDSGKVVDTNSEQVDAKMEQEKSKMIKCADGSDGPEVSYGFPRKQMYAFEKSQLADEVKLDEAGEPIVVDVRKMLDEMMSSDSCFVVFNTEEDRDAAMQFGKVPFDASKYEGCGKVELVMDEVRNEPANINWHNFGGHGPNDMFFRFLKGFFKVYVPALLIWFFCFYVPYAWSLYSFNYDNGAELPGYYSAIFTIVVCGGNATMYVVCDICCDMIGFRYKDTKQVTYMIMYLAACMINVFLDMVVTYWTAWEVMTGLDFRTYHGERLDDIKPFTEQFETYAMQRSLGANTYAYAWPSTFFLCFLIEPVVTILVPYQLGKVIIRTHREIRGTCAEAYLMAFEFDLGRYADILLNVFLGILIFYFPGGYIWTLFFFMCFSHCFIYCFDHWRVINVIPCVKIVSMEIDWYAQLTMCGLCAVILACLVFKANCETYVNYCMTDMPLITACSVAGIGHFIVHALLLIYLVPKFSLDRNDVASEQGVTFRSVAAKEPRTWFSVNPIHCLRSQYHHKQAGQPHCHLACWGKEHLLQYNEKINCFFVDGPAEAEDYGAQEWGNQLRKSVSRSLKKDVD